jgi:acyl-CoA thioester hydrolase
VSAPFVVHEYVRWGDVDIVGIIRYDAYLRFFELAESEMQRAVGLLYNDMVARHGITLPRKVMHAEFITPARLDERLEIRTYVSAVGHTSLTLNFDMFADDGTARAKGYLVVVAVDVQTLEKRPLPAEVVERLVPHTVLNA